MANSPIRESIAFVGQRYYDEPVIAKPKHHVMDPLRASIAAAFNQAETPRRIVVRHERVRLRWLKPVRDAQGNHVKEADGSFKLEPK